MCPSVGWILTLLYNILQTLFLSYHATAMLLLLEGGVNTCPGLT